MAEHKASEWDRLIAQALEKAERCRLEAEKHKVAGEYDRFWACRRKMLKHQAILRSLRRHRPGGKAVL